MAREVERKFRVTRCNVDRLRDGEDIIQGYLSFEPEVRVRVKGDKAWLTVKGPGMVERDHFEYSIPVRDAKQLLELTKARITKKRCEVEDVEIDVFGDNLQGLILAEVELENINSLVKRPEWLEWEEVTGDPAYLNANLARCGAPACGTEGEEAK